MLMRRLLVLAAASAVALVAAVAARAEIVVKQDAVGRPITFDVLAPGVDVDWYASLLAGAVHGDEITRVTVRIVEPSAIRGICGAGAVACYSGGRSSPTITVPAGRSDSLAATVLHEYGHHLDRAWAVSGVQELNGTPVWWQLRGMSALLASGSVAFDYSLGWDRSIAEVFAEDYAYIHLGGFYSIRWLAPPDGALKDALLAELGGTPGTLPATPAPVPAAATPTQPVTVTRSGVLARGAREAIPFRLLGAGRRVTFRATVTAARRTQPAARLEIACDGAVVARVPVTPSRAATIDRGGLGPATCDASIVNTSSAAQRFSAQLRLAIAA